MGNNIEGTAAAVAHGAAGPLELIVSDGRSSDHTREIVKGFSSRAWWPEAAECHLIKGSRGRAAQFRRGVEASNGSIVLFLHQETLLPPKYGTIVRETLNKPGVVCGAFGFDLDSLLLGIERREPGDHTWFSFQMHVLRWFMNVRSRWFEAPWGDQAIFLYRHVLDEVGGIASLSRLEDVELLIRLRKIGRIEVLDNQRWPALSASSRWRLRGLVRMSLLNYVLLILSMVGIPSEPILRWYVGRGK